MNLTEQALTVPNPDKTSSTLNLSYPLSKVFEAEARFNEMAGVNALTGPLLLQTFNEALRDLTRYLADLSYRESFAKRMVRQRRAVVVLEHMAERLATRKVPNNDTYREAIIESDAEYGVLSDVLHQIEAGFIFVREKLRAMESAINSTKRILDQVSYLSQFTGNTNLTMSTKGIQDVFDVKDVEREPMPTTTTATGMKVGKTRY